MHAKIIEKIFLTNLVKTINQRIDAFNKLGKLFSDISHKNKDSIYKQWVTVFDKKIKEAYQYNNWFTKENCLLSFKNWSKELTTIKLSKWIDNYNLKDCSNKNIAIIMAGNIPLVGFHDFICANILNYKCLIKMSSDDKILMPIIVDFLEFISPGFKNNIKFINKPLKNFEGVIATGSDSSFKHFEYYFKRYPKLLRKNRHSIAVLNGNESKENLIDLISKIGEKITVRRSNFLNYANCFNFFYIHTLIKDNIGKLGVILSLETKKLNSNIETLGHKLAMQIAASNPIGIDETDLDSNILQKEEEIIKEELKNTAKDKAILDKIAKGKLKKFVEENTLLNQVWIMDSKKRVKNVIEELAKNNTLKVKKFVRYKVGE